MGTKIKNYLAFDLGASNIRCMVGEYDEKKIRLEEVKKFENHHIQTGRHFYWDIQKIFHQIKECLQIAYEKYGDSIAGIGVDSWGVDFGLLDSSGRLLQDPYTARDPQTEGIFSHAFKRIKREEIYQITGITVLRLNTLFQLFSLVLRDDPVLKKADRFLMIPDLINYWLTGRIECNYTTASTSQLLNVYERQWAAPLLRTMGIPFEIFPAISQPGIILGHLLPDIIRESGLSNAKVVSVASHDTASAFLTVPADKGNRLCLSSGTWGLMGSNIDDPIVNEKALEYDLSNEGGAFGKNRLLSMRPNFWLLQECRRSWNMGNNPLSWDDIIFHARNAKGFTSLINPADEIFILTEDMPKAVQQYCEISGQTIPVSIGETARVIFESLACQYRMMKLQLSEVLNKEPDTLNIVGGGSRNDFLNQMAADACGVKVVSGPAEATVLGNIIMQLIALGEISGIDAGHEVIKASFPYRTFVPERSEIWEPIYSKFTDLLNEN